MAEAPALEIPLIRCAYSNAKGELCWCSCLPYLRVFHQTECPGGSLACFHVFQYRETTEYHCQTTEARKMMQFVVHRDGSPALVRLFDRFTSEIEVSDRVTAKGLRALEQTSALYFRPIDASQVYPENNTAVYHVIQQILNGHISSSEALAIADAPRLLKNSQIPKTAVCMCLDSEKRLVKCGCPSGSLIHCEQCPCVGQKCVFMEQSESVTIYYWSDRIGIEQYQFIVDSCDWTIEYPRTEPNNRPLNQYNLRFPEMGWRECCLSGWSLDRELLCFRPIEP